MGTISHLPRRDRPQPVRLGSDREAEAALAALVDGWQGAEPSLAQRREALKLSGLTAISLCAEAGGLDCSTALLARVVRQIESVDPGAAEALHRHFVLIDMFREEGDERFYGQLAEQSLAGDLLMGEADAARGTLDVRQEDFQSTASGEVLLPQAALFADWLWLPAINDAAGHLVEGSALVPVRAATLETRVDGEGREHLVARFRSAPVAHGLWARARPRLRTAVALDHLLEAARASVQLDLAGGGASPQAALRLSLARRALLALVQEAAAALDHAQVAPSVDSLGQADSLCRDAALFAADLTGHEGRFEHLATLAPGQC
ncbi:hypothetical protein [Gellertiella hungarica]|uniref:Acyl-CoA dehydrogenase n=1 Tax=Gellertiella hungarica TaxID=1572859 RepID=A0A7W6NJU7_9HYPH|nr:hypothetical protein [Gellertiella hungarica]MBB4063849.1 hypothetical protein [Gellertiella hungarica]